MIIDLETVDKGVNPYTISILKSRGTGKSFTQLAYNVNKLVTIWNGFNARSETADVSMEKVHYQHFVRLNNRKKNHSFSELDAAGYSCVKLPDGWIKQRDWCKQNLKPGAFINGRNYFWFAYDCDAVLFKMHWL